MKLDPRIKSIDSIRSFNTNNDDCLGKFGYFTNFITNFDDLSAIRNGICSFRDGSRFPFYSGDQKFQFFIPESELLPKEKQYRAFTIDEFLNQFDIGEVIVFRSKVMPNIVCHVLFDGYTETDKETFVILGLHHYSPKELFSNYEYDNGDNWLCFGVEE